MTTHPHDKARKIFFSILLAAAAAGCDGAESSAAPQPGESEAWETEESEYGESTGATVPLSEQEPGHPNAGADQLHLGVDPVEEWWEENPDPGMPAGYCGNQKNLCYEGLTCSGTVTGVGDRWDCGSGTRSYCTDTWVNGKGYTCEYWTVY